MQRKPTNNDRHLGRREGNMYRGPEPKPTPLPRPLGKGEHRCECGAAVRLRKDGTLWSHRTLVNKVLCIHSYTKPREES